MKRKLFTKKERTYQNSKPYTFRELELAFEHSLKLNDEKDAKIKELEYEVERYEKIFDDNKKNKHDEAWTEFYNDIEEGLDNTNTLRRKD